MTETIKAEFGKRFRAARDAKKLSRAALGIRLGVSPKTIQSWEMGRTFIEKLSLIPAIESELDINVSELIQKSVKQGTGSMAAESTASYGSAKGRVMPGPVTAQFDLHAAGAAGLPDPEKLTNAWVAVPLVKTRSAGKPVSDLDRKDISGHVVVPGEWQPRGGVLVAYRMGDSSMVPMVPLGGTVIVDRRPMEVDKALNRVVALFLQDRGLRIRRLLQEEEGGPVMGLPELEGGRGKAPFREDRGDVILGRVVGILAQPD